MLPLHQIDGFIYKCIFSSSNNIISYIISTLIWRILLIERLTVDNIAASILSMWFDQATFQRINWLNAHIHLSNKTPIISNNILN